MKESSNILTEKCFESIKKLTFNNGQNHITWVDHRFSIIVQFNEQWPIQSFFCFKCPNSVNYLNQTVKIGLDSLNTNSIFEFRNANKKKNDVLVESSSILSSHNLFISFPVNFSQSSNFILVFRVFKMMNVQNSDWNISLGKHILCANSETHENGPLASLAKANLHMHENVSNCFPSVPFLHTIFHWMKQANSAAAATPMRQMRRIQ